MTFVEQKIKITCENIRKYLRESNQRITDMLIAPCEYKTENFPQCNDEDWKPFSGGAITAKKIDSHFWVKFSVDVPKAEENKEYRLCVRGSNDGMGETIHPQCTLFLDGETTAHQAFDTRHYDAPLTEGHHDVAIYYYTGMNSCTADLNVFLTCFDLPTEKLYYDIYVPFAALAELQKNSAEYNAIRNAVDHACTLLDFRGKEEFRASCPVAIDYMEKEFYSKICGKGTSGKIDLIGHTHIDVAWQWTLAQTREKAQRSFSTAVRLMEKYPEYIFQSSQPQLYEYVKESDPELYEKVKKLIAEGRWEAEGAMWLESDTNLVSGESLIRQILIGKKFMKDEFNAENYMLWLPDVFGYSAALPQILKKSGVPYFFTTKISWSETNTFPHDSFIWQGIDGSEVFAVLGKTYVSELNPKSIMTAWKKHDDKTHTARQISTFGWGDGGGGPTTDMLENFARLKRGIPGLPEVKIQKSLESLKQAEKEFLENSELLKWTPKWQGELYLEFHRGTYTSIAKNKNNNRRSEFLYGNLEVASVADMLLCNGEYPVKMLYDNWKTILKNQFHDIIPGSSIEQVYIDSDREYKQVLDDGNEAFAGKLDGLCSNVATDGGVFVYNPNGFALSDYVKDENGKVYYAENVPAQGWTVVKETAQADSTLKAQDKVLENDVIRVCFDEKFNICSVYDKVNGREVIDEGQRANVLEIFEDYPRAYDAWEITEYYMQKKWLIDDVTDVSYINEGCKSGIKISRKYRDSVIEQTISLKPASRRIDFETDVEWQEDHVLLKAAFPLSVRSENTTYEIACGHIERPNHKNTSWDRAKFEVSGHKWADMSEYGYGVSLLNDCKYGYSTEENIIKLTLLKAPTYPNPKADKGHHRFTYSLYPHADSFIEGGTIKEAFLLNNPLVVKTISKQDGKLPESYSLVTSSYEGFIPNAVKLAEDGNGVIVRGYEAFGGKHKVKLDFGFGVEKVYACDLMENNLDELATDGNSVSVDVSNFEIATFRVVPKK